MKSLFRPFPLPLTRRQKFYLLVLQGLGAGIIDGGANFGIAYAMYGNQDQVKMWIFSQNTIAGDLGVTPIIQCLASMLISSTLVHTDLHNHAIQPLAFCYPHVEHLPDPRGLFRRGKKGRKGGEVEKGNEKDGEGNVDVEKGMRSNSGVGHAGQSSSSTSSTTPRSPSSSPTPDHLSTPHPSGIKHYYLLLLRFIFEGTEQNMLLARPGLKAWFGRLGWTALQGAAIGVVFGFPLWCLAILILGPIYKMDNMGGKWAPQVIKGVYGAVVGWVTNPVIAVLALGSQAECHLIVVEDVEGGGVGADGEGAGGGEGDETREGQEGEGGGMEELAIPIPTIHEGRESEFDPAYSPGGSFRRESGNTLAIASGKMYSPSRPGSRRGSQSAVLGVGTGVGTASHSTGPASATLDPSRARSGSTSSRHSSTSLHSRPPLTANASFLSPLPSTSGSGNLGTGTGVGTSGTRRRSSSTVPQSSLVSAFDGSRQRGSTISHGRTTAGEGVETAPSHPLPVSLSVPPSPLVQPSTPRSYSYALGGTGGRAQRSRSASVISRLVPEGPAQGAAGVQGGNANPNAGASAITGGGQTQIQPPRSYSHSTTNPTYSPSPSAPGSARPSNAHEYSDLVGSRTPGRQSNAQTTQTAHTERGDAPSMGGRSGRGSGGPTGPPAVWDVFGRRESTDMGGSPRR